jgi:hypothetical protein
MREKKKRRNERRWNEKEQVELEERGNEKRMRM